MIGQLHLTIFVTFSFCEIAQTYTDCIQYQQLYQ